MTSWHQLRRKTWETSQTNLCLFWLRNISPDTLILAHSPFLPWIYVLDLWRAFSSTHPISFPSARWLSWFLLVYLTVSSLVRLDLVRTSFPVFPPHTNIDNWKIMNSSCTFGQFWIQRPLHSNWLIVPQSKVDLDRRLTVFRPLICIFFFFFSIKCALNSKHHCST